MFMASPVQLRAAESLKARLVSIFLAGLAAACAFAAIATSLYAAPHARALALGVYSMFGTGAGLACVAIGRLWWSATPGPAAIDAMPAAIDTLATAHVHELPPPADATVDSPPPRASAAATATADAENRVAAVEAV